MSDMSAEIFQAAAAEALAGFDDKPAEEQEALRRDFMFALTAGILSSIRPDAEGVIVDQDRAEVRKRARLRMREQWAAGVGQTSLQLLRASQEILVEEYDAQAAVDPRFAPEREVAHVTRNWALSEPRIDEAFATEVLDYIKL